jgi:hypothetical protein
MNYLYITEIKLKKPKQTVRLILKTNRKMVETEPQSYVLGSYGTAIINLKNGGEN